MSQNQDKSTARLCVWSIDVNIANNTNNAAIPLGVNGGYANSGTAGYHAKCVYPAPSLPLTGSGAAQGTGEVIGYVTCPSAGSNEGCSVSVVGYLPWSGSDTPYAVTDNDLLGVAGAWLDVSGSILGSGGQTEAVFTNTQLQTVLQAYSCFVTSDATEVTPPPCPNPNPPWIAALLQLTAAPAMVVCHWRVEQPPQRPCYLWLPDFQLLALVLFCLTGLWDDFMQFVFAAVHAPWMLN